MNEILTALRQLLLDHLAAAQALTANIGIGATSISVSNTSQFVVNDTCFLMSQKTGLAEAVTIKRIVDDKTFSITPTVGAWTVASGAILQKAINKQFLKGVYIGDLPNFAAFPCVTIDASSEDNEWFTIRSTSHDYKLNIRAYVLADSFETTNLYLPALAQQIREILIDNIHPIIEPEPHLLTSDLVIGGTVVGIDDTTNFRPNEIVFIRDNAPRPASEENASITVLSQTQLEIEIPATLNYLVSRGATLYRIKRYLYDTRPDSISYGFSPGKGGALLRVAEINYFAKEQICRNTLLIS